MQPASTRHAAARAVEGGQHPVTGRLDEPAAEALDLALHEQVVLIEQLTPLPVARRRRPARWTRRCRRTSPSTAPDRVWRSVRPPVRNDSTSSTKRSASNTTCSPGISTNRAPSMLSASQRPLSIGTVRSSVVWTTRVGTEIARAAARTSLFDSPSRTARIVPGLPAGALDPPDRLADDGMALERLGEHLGRRAGAPAVVEASDTDRRWPPRCRGGSRHRGDIGPACRTARAPSCVPGRWRRRGCSSGHPRRCR